MAPAPVPVAQVRLLAFNNEEIGMGFNSDTGIAVGTALEGFTVQADPVATGQAVTSQIVIVNSHEELMDNLSMSFDAQGRYGFISGSAKASFAENSSYNSTSTFLVAQCLVSNPMTRGQNFQVTQSAQALLSTQRFADFKTAFGDSFVRGLHTGGEYYAVIRITSVSVSKQKDLSATLHAEAQGLVASGSFQAQFQEANSSDSTRSEYTASMFQQAGTGSQISPTVQIDEVLSRYKQFPQIALANPGAYETEVATYDTLPLPTPTAEQQEDFVLAMADARDKKLHYIQTRNDLTFALANPGFFQELPPVTVLTAASETYTKLINAVVEHAVALSQGQISPPVFFDPAALTPPLAEPSPIALQRAADAPAPSILVPSLIGLTQPAILTINVDLEHPGAFTTAEIAADASNSGVPVTVEQVEFLRLSKGLGAPSVPITFQYQGIDPNLLEDFTLDPVHTFVINEQLPLAGTLVAPGTTVTLIFVVQPGT